MWIGKLNRYNDAVVDINFTEKRVVHLFSNTNKTECPKLNWENKYEKAENLSDREQNIIFISSLKF